MLQLRNITKEYKVGSGTITALNDVNLDLRESEFVAVLGPSGCGKTTLLNIVGGLDSYTSGDLIINGTSTKDYRDSNWDVYRNHRVGFVFQSYNLIPHQDALANVELSLRLSGISKAKRRELATVALERVGLGDQLHKKPSMMSGGQMQRVAIARALVNDPDIILADEPTGALDSETSRQVIGLLKEIASNKLVIMVTHNPELADLYATRIIRLKDGQILSDSDAVTPQELSTPPAQLKAERTKLGFSAALGLSLNNLMTKKGRTILTSLAGAIGIIGIALILALSNGMNEYISSVESETMGSYPIELQRETLDISGMMDSAADRGGQAGNPFAEVPMEEEAPTVIIANNRVENSVTSAARFSAINDLGKFKSYLEANTNRIGDSLAAVEYGYSIEPQVYRFEPVESADADNEQAGSDREVLLVSPTSLDTGNSGSWGPMGNQDSGGMGGMGSFGANFGGMGSFGSSTTLGGTRSEWAQLVNNQTLRESHYELLEGSWPTAYNEIALVVSEDNRISDFVLYMLGVMDINEMNELISALENGEDVEEHTVSFTYDEILGLEYQVFAPCQLYTKSESDDVWIDRRTDQNYLQELFIEGTTVTITGVLRSGDGAGISSGVTYTGALTDFLMNITLESDIIQEQLADPDTNVLTGLAFEDSTSEEGQSDSQEGEQTAVEELATEEEQASEEQSALEGPAAAFGYGGFGPNGFDMSGYEGYDSDTPPGEATFSLTSDQLAVLLAQMSDATPASYDEVLEALGYGTVDQPISIALYPVDFEGKSTIEEFIVEYNNQVQDEDDRVTYTDMIGILTSSITSIVNIISYVLIAFVAISLIVSSIMIAIITYISVLERTKEIGVLRALGASKGDVSKIFNAETFIEGLLSGVSAILLALLICIPINMVIFALVGVENIASLPLQYSLILIAISVALNLIAGFIPSRLAAKKDPVVALRTE